MSAAAEELDKRIGGRIARLVKRGDLRGKAGDVVLLADLTGAPVERVVVVGLGGRNAFKRKQYRKALASALGAVAARARRMRSAISASTASAMPTRTR